MFQEHVPLVRMIYAVDITDVGATGGSVCAGDTSSGSVAGRQEAAGPAKKIGAENFGPWIPIKIKALVWLLEVRSWQWYVLQRKKGPQLQLVCPRGVHWDFRLNRGAWLRRAEGKEIQT